MGSEENGEVLMMLDEASVLSGLAGVEQALVMGRSAGVRLLLAYQSDAQVIAAFRDKPSLLYDNCSSQIYLGASSLETAERLSKMLGSWTQGVESLGDNWGESRSAGREGGHQVSRGGSSNLAPQARPLLYPDEILRLSNEYMIAFLGGFPAAIFAKRIKWYSDHAFNPAVPKPPWFSRIQWVRVRPKWLAFGLVVALFFGVMAREKSQRQFVPDQPLWRYEPQRSEPKMKGGLSPQKPLKER
jgi:type IV secretory pathway TraG/TraD family ATPase VirD4